MTKIEWQTEVKKELLIKSGTTDEQGWYKLKDAFSNFLSESANTLVDQKLRCDELVIEIWLDSARLIAKATDESKNDGPNHVVVQLISTFILHNYGEIPSEDESPNLFEKLIVGLISDVSSTLLSASLREPASSSLKRLRSICTVKLFLQIAGDESTKRFTSI